MTRRGRDASSLVASTPIGSLASGSVGGMGECSALGTGEKEFVLVARGPKRKDMQLMPVNLHIVPKLQVNKSEVNRTLNGRYASEVRRPATNAKLKWCKRKQMKLERPYSLFKVSYGASTCVTG